MKKKRILVICTGNAARSQMAEGLFRHKAGDQIDVFSAGTHPSCLNPHAVEAMREIGIDISHQYSKSVEEFRYQKFDRVITVCDSAKQECPVFPVPQCSTGARQIRTLQQLFGLQEICSHQGSKLSFRNF